MLDNYATNEDGIVYQIEKKPFDYTGHYNDYYTKIKFCTRYSFITKVRHWSERHFI